jgi:hypothetical protein
MRKYLGYYNTELEEKLPIKRIYAVFSIKITMSSPIIDLYKLSLNGAYQTQPVKYLYFHLYVHLLFVTYILTIV